MLSISTACRAAFGAHQLPLVLCHQHKVLAVLATDEACEGVGLVWLTGLWQGSKAGPGTCCSCCYYRQQVVVVFHTGVLHLRCMYMRTHTQQYMTSSMLLRVHIVRLHGCMVEGLWWLQQFHAVVWGADTASAPAAVAAPVACCTHTTRDQCHQCGLPWQTGLLLCLATQAPAPASAAVAAVVCLRQSQDC